MSSSSFDFHYSFRHARSRPLVIDIRTYKPRRKRSSEPARHFSPSYHRDDYRFDWYQHPRRRYLSLIGPVQTCERVRQCERLPPVIMQQTVGQRPGSTPAYFVLENICREAQRCRSVVAHMGKLRRYLSRADYLVAYATFKEIEKLRGALMDLVDLFQIYRLRLQLVLYYVDIAIKSVSFTLLRMDLCLNERRIPPDTQWREICRSLYSELRTMPIQTRFVIYLQFFSMMNAALSGSSLYDSRVAEPSHRAIMALVRGQQITSRSSFQTPPSFADLSRYVLHPGLAHWCQRIFDHRPASQTLLGQRTRSKSLGAANSFGPMNAAPNPVILFQRTFDNDISISALMNKDDSSVGLLLRHINGSTPWYCLEKVDDLYIRRSHSTINLYRRSRSSRDPKPWAALNFQTWEELILFYCSFLGLKLQHASMHRVRVPEVAFKCEAKYFETNIQVEGVAHRLTVFSDTKTANIRLHAAKADSPMVGRPAWTIFLTDRFTVHQTSSREVRLRNVRVYSFLGSGFTQGSYPIDYDIVFFHARDRHAFVAVFRDMVLI